MTQSQFDTITKATVEESYRLSEKVGKVFIDEDATPEVGIVSMAMSIAYALQGLSSPLQLDDNIETVADIIRRVANGHGASLWLKPTSTN